jgi:sugar phosphate isomerase/epimerase
MTPITPPRLGTLTGGFGRWVLIHKGPPPDYATKTRVGDTIMRPGWPLTEVLPVLADIGYDAVTVCGWPGHAAHVYSQSDTTRAQIPRLARDLGLTLTGFSAMGGSRHAFDRFGYATADPDERAERMAYTEACLRLAAQWGVGHVEDVAGMLPPGMAPAEGLARIVDAVGHFAEVAHSLGIRYALEPYMGVVNTTAKWLELAEQVSHPGLAAIIDPANLLAEESTSLGQIAATLGGYAVATHLKGFTAEGRITTPGGPADTMDIVGLWAGLTQAGYAGVLTFEEYPDSYPTPLDPLESARRAHDAVRALFEGVGR